MSSHRTRHSDWIGIVVICCVTSGLMYVRSRLVGDSTTGKSHHAVGRTIPLVSLAPLIDTDDGLELKDLHGKVVLLNFWGTWCPPCRDEFPHIVQIHMKYSDQARFQLASVSCGNGREDRSNLDSTTRAFLRSQNAKLPVFWDPDGQTRLSLMIGAELHEVAYPTTVLLDSSGVIRALWLGFRQAYAREMETMVDQLLVETASASVSASNARN